MSDALFQALFSYRPVVFNEGEFRFDPTATSLAGAVVVAVVVGVAIWTYRRVRVSEGRLRDRLVLTSLRVAALGLVLFCLFRPTLVVRAAIPQQNVVAVLIDDSRSMQIPDVAGKSRAQFVQGQLGDPASPLMKSLSERFRVRLFRFSSTPGRVTSVKDLGFTGAETNIGAALDGVRDELAGLPVSAIVLVSDGADTSEAPIAQALLNMRAQKLPVFTVGVGSERLARDVQIDRVSTPRSVLKNASVFIDVVLTHSGFGGRTVTLDVEDDGRIIGSQKVQLPSDGRPVTAKVRATAAQSGPRLFKFRVSPLEGEIVTQNNAREAMIQVRDVREKILYFDGEPRWEIGFLRRAIADDKNLEVVVVVRTADNKYMRMFVNEPDDPNELVSGFPTSREELFKYSGLILGSVEASYFTGDQLQMIAEFVDKRGGGLLMLGGARSFGEGGYGGTPLADVLPLAIDSRTRASEATYFARLKVGPTPAGGEHAVTQIDETESASLARWPKLPPVTAVNAPLPLKPGASLLLTATDERGRSYPVLSAQKFGRGKAIALPLQETLPWQMHVSIAVDDQVHERFWRQMLRYLVEGVPGRVEVRTTVERVEPGAAATIEASVVDPAFLDVNDASVVAHVTGPGLSTTVPLRWTGDRAGLYRGTVVTREPGPYEIAVDATRSEKSAGSGMSILRAASGEAEFFDPTMHAAALARIAQDTGGRFYTPETVEGIAEDARYAGRGVTSVEERPLWNMPILLLLLMVLVCGEWGYRRAVGLS
jgi:uncharacterized membrane protein